MLPRRTAGFYASLPRDLRSLDVVLIRRPLDASGARSILKPIRPRLVIAALRLCFSKLPILSQYAQIDQGQVDGLLQLLPDSVAGNDMNASVDVANLIPSVEVPDDAPDPNNESVQEDVKMRESLDDPLISELPPPEPTFIPQFVEDLTEADRTALGLEQAIAQLSTSNERCSANNPFQLGGTCVAWPNVDVGAAPISETTPGLLELAFPDLFASHPGSDPTLLIRDRPFSIRGDGTQRISGAPTLADGFAHLLNSCQEQDTEEGLVYYRFPFIEHPFFVFYVRNLLLRLNARSDVGRFQVQHPDRTHITLGEMEKAVNDANSGERESLMRLAKDLRRMTDKHTGQPGYWLSLQRSAEAVAETHGLANVFISMSAADNYWPELLRVLRPNWPQDALNALSHTEVARIVRANPNLCSVYIDRVHKAIFENIVQDALQCASGTQRNEWQHRQTVHAHDLGRLTLPNGQDVHQWALQVLVARNARRVLHLISHEHFCLPSCEWPIHAENDVSILQQCAERDELQLSDVVRQAQEIAVHQPLIESWNSSTGFVDLSVEFELGQSCSLELDQVTTAGVGRLLSIVECGNQAEASLIRLYDMLASAWIDGAGHESANDAHPSSIRMPDCHTDENWSPEIEALQQEDRDNLRRAVQCHEHRASYCLKWDSQKNRHICRFGAPWSVQEQTSVDVQAKLIGGARAKRVQVTVKMQPRRNNSKISPSLNAIAVVLRANSDFQLIIDPPAITRYVFKYAFKPNPSSSTLVDLVKDVASTVRHRAIGVNAPSEINVGPQILRRLANSIVGQVDEGKAQVSELHVSVAMLVQAIVAVGKLVDNYHMFNIRIASANLFPQRELVVDPDSGGVHTAFNIVDLYMHRLRFSDWQRGEFANLDFWENLNLHSFLSDFEVPRIRSIVDLNEAPVLQKRATSWVPKISPVYNSTLYDSPYRYRYCYRMLLVWRSWAGSLFDVLRTIGDPVETIGDVQGLPLVEDARPSRDNVFGLQATEVSQAFKDLCVQRWQEWLLTPEAVEPLYQKQLRFHLPSEMRQLFVTASDEFALLHADTFNEDVDSPVDSEIDEGEFNDTGQRPESRRQQLLLEQQLGLNDDFLDDEAPADLEVLPLLHADRRGALGQQQQQQPRGSSDHLGVLQEAELQFQWAAQEFQDDAKAVAERHRKLSLGIERADCEEWKKVKDRECQLGMQSAFVQRPNAQSDGDLRGLQRVAIKIAEDQFAAFERNQALGIEIPVPVVVDEGALDDLPETGAPLRLMLLGSAGSCLSLH